MSKKITVTGLTEIKLEGFGRQAIGGKIDATGQTWLMLRSKGYYTVYIDKVPQVGKFKYKREAMESIVKDDFTEEMPWANKG